MSNPVLGELVKRVVKVTTENAKYLSITISQDLSWKTHVENISSKANNTLKFLKRNIQTQNKKKTKKKKKKQTKKNKKTKKPLTIPTSDLSLSTAPLYGIHGRGHYHIRSNECRVQQLDM